jgi:hypothetical protein
MKRKKEKCGFMRLPYCLCVGVSPFLNHMTDFYETWYVYCSIGRCHSAAIFSSLLLVITTWQMHVGGRNTSAISFGNIFVEYTVAWWLQIFSLAFGLMVVSNDLLELDIYFGMAIDHEHNCILCTECCMDVSNWRRVIMWSFKVMSSKLSVYRVST